MMSKKTQLYVAIGCLVALAALFLIPLLGRFTASPKDPKWVSYDTNDPGMTLARQQAKESFPHFLDAWKNAASGADAFEVAVGQYTRRGTPIVIWLDDLQIDTGGLSGRITEAPVERLRPDKGVGDRIAFQVDDVRDWAYLDGELYRGYFGLRQMNPDAVDGIGRAGDYWIHAEPLP